MTKNFSTKTVVSLARLSTTKLAAVYFDHVVPIYVEDAPYQLFPPGFEDWTPSSPLALLEKA